MAFGLSLSDIEIKPLDSKTHNRAAFVCGKSELDSYIRDRASQDAKRYASSVYVAVAKDSTVVGYYTLSQYSVNLNTLPPDLKRALAPYLDTSATLLGRLAVHRQLQGGGFGKILLLDALKRALDQARSVASALCVVDAKDHDAKRFYEHFGFIALPDQMRLFLPMKTIARMFS
jgi:GNAT superfamily N-acetyltransferase